MLCRYFVYANVPLDCDWREMEALPSDRLPGTFGQVAQRLGWDGTADRIWMSTGVRTTLPIIAWRSTGTNHKGFMATPTAIEFDLEARFEIVELPLSEIVKIEEGRPSLVQLISGGPPMVVEGYRNDDRVECVWITNDGLAQWATFSKQSLKPYRF